MERPDFASFCGKCFVFQGLGQNRGAPKTAVPTTTHPIPQWHLTPSECWGEPRCCSAPQAQHPRITSLFAEALHGFHRTGSVDHRAVWLKHAHGTIQRLECWEALLSRERNISPKFSYVKFSESTRNLIRERSNSGSHWSGFAIFRPAILTFYKSYPFLDFPWN